MASSSLDLPYATAKRLTARNNVFVGKVKANAGEADVLMERSKAARGKMAGFRLLVKFQGMHEARQWLVYQDLARKLFGLSSRRQFGTALYGRW